MALLEEDYQIRCAGMLAYLEGLQARRGMDSISPPCYTLEDLDRRLRVLEISVNHTGSHPVAVLSWKTIAWRLVWLYNQQSRHPVPAPPGRQTATCFDTLLPDNFDVDIQDVEAVISDMSSDFGLLLPTTYPDAESPGPDARIGVARHRLLFLVGARKVPLKAVPITLRDMFVLAVNTSFRKGLMMPWNAPSPFVPPPPPPPVINRRFSSESTRPRRRGRNVSSFWPRFKRHSGCSCDCHRRGRAYSYASSDHDSVGKDMGGPTRGSRFGWLRSLVCWRRRPQIADDSSFSSSVMSR